MAWLTGKTDDITVFSFTGVMGGRREEEGGNKLQPSQYAPMDFLLTKPTQS